MLITSRFILSVEMSCKGCGVCHKGITGSGVLLVSGEDLILILDSSKKYRDPGGKMEKDIEKHKTSENAARELWEETRGVVKVDAAELRRCPKINIEKVRMILFIIDSSSFMY